MWKTEVLSPFLSIFMFALLAISAKILESTSSISTLRPFAYLVAPSEKCPVVTRNPFVAFEVITAE